jgi:DNA end-binding protein Ku
MVTAVRDLDLHFRQLHEKDGAPIEVQRWCSKEDVEVPYEEIAHAFEFDDGSQVIVSDEELEAIEPRRTRTIEIEQFVDLDEVDPIYFDHPYYLLPAGSDDGSARAYRLLVDVMARTDRAALGRFVMRAKEYLAIVRARDGALMLSTMLFADEIVPRAAIEEFAEGEAEVSDKELAIAEQLVGSLSADWDPERYKDTYRERVLALVQAKAEGREIVEHALPEPAARVDDLMAALEASLAAATKQATTKKAAAAKKPRRAAAPKSAT